MTATILCIEDNHFKMRLSTKLLQLIGYNVLTAPTGLVGLDIASKKRPDLILIDTDIYHINGIPILKRLKHMARTRHIPTIAVIEKAIDSDYQRYLAVGFDACIAKPNLHIDLQTIVKDILHPYDHNEARTS